MIFGQTRQSRITVLRPRDILNFGKKLRQLKNPAARRRRLFSDSHLYF